MPLRQLIYNRLLCTFITAAINKEAAAQCDGMDSPLFFPTSWRFVIWSGRCTTDTYRTAEEGVGILAKSDAAASSRGEDAAVVGVVMNWWLSPELLTLIILISSCTCKHDCSIGSKSKAILNLMPLMRVGRPWKWAIERREARDGKLKMPRFCSDSGTFMKVYSCKSANFARFGCRAGRKVNLEAYLRCMYHSSFI